MDENKRLIRNTGIIAIGNLSTKLVSFLLLPLYTSILSTAEYGVIDYIFSIAAFCVPFVSLLMDESIFRFLIDCKNDYEQKKVISTAITIVIGGLCSFFVISLPILCILKYKYSVFLILYIVVAVISGMLSALIRGIGRTEHYAIFNFLVSFIQIVLNVIFIALLSMGITGMLLASIISQLLVTIFYGFYLKIWEYVELKNISKMKMKEMVYYSLPLIPNKISWLIINLSSRIIIMNTLGSSSTGLYAVANKFPTLMDTVYGFFYQSWKESSARVLGDSTKDRFYNDVYGHLKSFMYSLVIMMIAFMHLLFHFLINDTYNEAILYVPILILATYFSNMSGFYGGIFTAYKNTKIMGITTIVAAVINIVFNLIFVKYFGLYGIAISTLLANYVVYFYRKRKVNRYVALDENKKKKFISILITCVIWGLFYINNVMSGFIACIVAVIYSVIENCDILKMIVSMLKVRIDKLKKVRNDEK